MPPDGYHGNLIAGFHALDQDFGYFGKLSQYTL